MKKQYYLLIAIFVLVLALRVFISFQTKLFSDDESYYILRQVENIDTTGKPILYDALSYSGRNVIFLPVYYYLLSFFNLFLPEFYGLKIIVNILAASLVFVIYLLTKEISKNTNAALFGAFTAGFLPIFFRRTVNSLSPLSFTVPLLFLLLYLILKIHKGDKRFVTYFLVALLVLIFTQTSSLILVCSLLVYLLLMKVEGIKETKSQFEITLFSLFLSLWLYFILFKNLLFKYNVGIFRQNIPQQILINYFKSLNPIQLIYLIGILPFIIGIYMIYKYLFKEKSSSLYLMLSFALTVGFLLWITIVPFEEGIIYLGIILVVLLAQSIRDSSLYLQKMHTNYFPVYLLLMVIVITLTQSTACYTYGTQKLSDIPTENQIEALDWVKQDSDQNARVLGTVKEGHLINYFAQRKDIIDSNFLLVGNTNELYQDIERMYQTNSLIEASRLLTKYKISYILFSPNTKEEFGVHVLQYVNEDCFDMKNFGDIIIYTYKCKLE